jgi:hypothetical protein
LIFSLLSRINQSESQVDLRELVEKLHSLELLEVEKLASLNGGSGTRTDGGDRIQNRISEIMYEYGMNDQQIQDSILVMHEAAKSLIKYHGGKIQKYLRKYGQQMIDEIDQNFTFSKLDDKERRHAFTFWLQNVTNVPVSLMDENVKVFCEYFKIKPYELVEVADKLNINLALVDDLIQARLIEAAATSIEAQDLVGESRERENEQR